MKKRITAYHSHVQALREHAAKTTLGDLLVGAAPADFGRMLDELLEISYRQCVALLGYIAAPRLCRSFTVAGVPDTWTAMRLYCERRYPGHAALTAAHHLFELLAYLFQPAELRVRYGPGIALQNLERDRDDLVTGPKQLDYTKEGILDGNRWLNLDAALPGGSMTGGFVDQLLRVRSGMSRPPAYFGVAIEPDVVRDATDHSPIVTLAYIRGPRGLPTEELLNSPRFPARASGTVTQHDRTSTDPLLALFPLIRLEVLWSARNGVKTVQMEELRPPAADSADDLIVNRYIHARWSPTVGAFIHFDGALRTYRRCDYDGRLATDIGRSRERVLSYRKLFRLDAPLGVHHWGDLASRFFENNELVPEYFDDLAGDNA